MRGLAVTLAGAIGGALLAVAIVLTLADQGMMPINEGQMQSWLMRHPDLALAMIGRQQQLDDARKQAQQASAMKKVGQQSFFDSRIAFVTGPADAKTSVVEFYDYDCPYCRASQPEVQKFYETHKADTRFSFIELPLDIHGPNAVLAARASIAARNQPDKYVAFHFAMMSNKDPVDADAIFDIAQKAGLDLEKLRADMNRPEIEDIIKKSHELATKVGIDGTPTFIVNGQMHPGMVQDGELEQLAKTT
ncbi:MAG TPA: DsbA family protein [Rhizomicrobium sp.]|jgi:protein-disulfide isomerase|nr:DsbA family protein [Rhizomicrobium sp.]